MVMAMVILFWLFVAWAVFIVFVWCAGPATLEETRNAMYVACFPLILLALTEHLYRVLNIGG